MASTTIKGNYEKGTLTLESPFTLKSWGEASYAKVGSLALITFYASYFTADVGANTPVVDLPFTSRRRQGLVVESQTGEKALFFIGGGQNKLYVDGATAGGDFYFQFLIDVY